MSATDIVFLSATSIFVLLSAAWLISAIYFYSVYYDRLSKKIDGHVFDGGFLFCAVRFSTWGIYCLSKSLARRHGVAEAFQSLPRPARNHLIFQSSVIAYFVLLMLLFGVLEFMGES